MKSSIKEAGIEKVETLYGSSELLSLRTASTKVGLSKRKVSTILLLEILKKAYKAKTRKDVVEPIESQLTPFKIMVWATVSSKRLIGRSYFFHKNGSHITVNQETHYGDCVSRFVGNLKENHNVKSSWFTQNGAPSHTSHHAPQISPRGFLAIAHTEEDNLQ